MQALDNAGIYVDLIFTLTNKLCGEFAAHYLLGIQECTNKIMNVYMCTHTQMETSCTHPHTIITCTQSNYTRVMG